MSNHYDRLFSSRHESRVYKKTGNGRKLEALNVSHEKYRSSIARISWWAANITSAIINLLFFFSLLSSTRHQTTNAFPLLFLGIRVIVQFVRQDRGIRCVTSPRYLSSFSFQIISSQSKIGSNIWLKKNFHRSNHLGKPALFKEAKAPTLPCRGRIEKKSW